MIVDNLNLLRTILPHKTDSPLVIDADAPLSGAVALQRFQPVARQAGQVAQPCGAVQVDQLALRCLLDLWWKRSRPLPPKNALGLFGL
jgi:hypothetical protein